MVTSMRSVLEFLVHFMLALTGAIGMATLTVGGIALACGCGLLGGGWCWRAWGRRRAKRKRR